jgi:ATP-dependent Clp protease protease subunit
MNELWIYDDIGPDWLGLVSSKYVISELGKFKGKPVTVRINSPGGDVVEAQAIYNALRRHSAGGGEVTTENDALAASAASYIFMAGDVRRVAENSMTMIHRAWTIAMGNAEELRETAGVMDKFDSILADAYEAGTGMERAALEQMLADETWLTSSEAIAHGFAQEIGQSLNVSASVKPGRFAKTPERLITGEPSKREVARTNRIEQVQQQIRLSRARLGV